MSSVASETSSVDFVSDPAKFITKATERFSVVPLPNGQSVRLRKLKWGEEKLAAVYPVDQRFLAVVLLALVDEHGDTIFRLNENTLAEFDDWDADIVEALIEAVQAFCLNTTDYRALAEDAAKNSEETPNASS